MKKGDRIKVICMDDSNGKDMSVHRMNGKTFTVNFVDDLGHIHLMESGLSVIPEVDEFVVIKK